MQTSRYLNPDGYSVELTKVSDHRYLLCSEPPRYVTAAEVAALYQPAEERRVRHAPRRHDRGGGRRRRDRTSITEDELRAKTRELVHFAELNLAMLRAWSNVDYPALVIE